MSSTVKLVLASALVAASATLASAGELPGPYYPGDHMMNYGPINQQSSNTSDARSAFAAVPGSAQQRVRAHNAPAYEVQDPWAKARQDDANEY